MKKLLKSLCTILLCSGLAACNVSTSATTDTRQTVRVALCQQSLLTGLPSILKEKFPNVKFEFTLAQNTAKYYEYLDEHDDLPDIITVRRFSLLDAINLKDSLVDLSNSEIASGYYQNYLNSYTYEDGTINWLPTLAEVWCIVANKTLFEENNIELPTDYASFVDACDKFEALGIQGFTTDWAYDYTCLETLEGFNIEALQSLEGREWRSSYESGETEQLDDTIWPEAFEHMYQVLQDTHNGEATDAENGFSATQEGMQTGKIAMIRSSAAEITGYGESDEYEYILLPYFGETEEENWLLTYPNYQAAMSAKSDVDSSTLEEIYSFILGKECQDALGTGNNVLSYSKDVTVDSNEYLQALSDYVDSNRIFIRLANDDFFTASQVAVQGMITGEYTASQAYDAFNASLKATKEVENDIHFDTTYEYTFNSEHGSEASSAILNSCRDVWGSDLALAYSVSISNSVYEGDFSSSNLRYLVACNPGSSWFLEVTGKQVKDLVSAMLSSSSSSSAYSVLEDNMLPVSSGFEMDILSSDGYTLQDIKIDGESIDEEKTYSITFCVPNVYAPTMIESAGIEVPKDGLDNAELMNATLAKYFETNDQLEKPTDYIKLSYE